MSTAVHCVECDCFRRVNFRSVRTSTGGLVRPVAAIVIRIADIVVRYTLLVVADELVWWTSYTCSNVILLPPTKEDVNAFARVCLSVCLSVSQITQKRVRGFG